MNERGDSQRWSGRQVVLGVSMCLGLCLVPSMWAGAASLVAELQVPPLGREGTVEGSGFDARWRIVPERGLVFPWVPTADLTILVEQAPVEGAEPLSSRDELRITLSQLAATPRLLVVSGTRVRLENDLADTAIVRAVDTAQEQSIDAGSTRDLMRDRFREAGVFSLEGASPQPWVTEVRVLDQPFATGSFEPIGGGLLRAELEGPFALEAGGEGSFRVWLWRSGQAICASGGSDPCMYELRGTVRDNHIALEPVPMGVDWLVTGSGGR